MVSINGRPRVANLPLEFHFEGPEGADFAVTPTRTQALAKANWGEAVDGAMPLIEFEAGYPKEYTKPFFFTEMFASIGEWQRYA